MAQATAYQQVCRRNLKKKLISISKIYFYKYNTEKMKNFMFWLYIDRILLKITNLRQIIKNLNKKINLPPGLFLQT